MNLQQASYILKVYECGSISAAAKALYVSQPALSHAIQVVEKEIGARIFDRTTVPISLTYAGERYLEAAKQLMELNHNLSLQLEEIKKEESGRLVIGVSTLRGAVFLPSILPEFHRQYPSVEIKLVETGSTQMEEMLLNGKVDLAFLISVQEKNHQIEYLKLCKERMVLYAGKNTDLAKRIPPFSEISIDEAKNETFVLAKKGHGVRSMQDHMFFELGMEPKIFLETESVVLAKNLALSCDMVALYPETLVTNRLPRSSIQESYYFIKGEEYTREFYLAYKKGAYITKYLAAFCEIAQNIPFHAHPLVQDWAEDGIAKNYP